MKFATKRNPPHLRHCYCTTLKNKSIFSDISLRFDKVTESLKLGTFLRHSVEPFNLSAICGRAFPVASVHVEQAT